MAAAPWPRSRRRLRARSPARPSKVPAPKIPRSPTPRPRRPPHGRGMGRKWSRASHRREIEEETNSRADTAPGTEAPAGGKDQPRSPAALVATNLRALFRQAVKALTYEKPKLRKARRRRDEQKGRTTWWQQKLQ